MKLSRSTGLVAGLLALGLLAAGPAVAAGPANVTVRVEGATQTRIPQTALTTLARQVNKDGQPGHTCTGTSAFGALDQAAGGDIGATWNTQFSQYFLDSIKGETPDPNSQFWAFWINYKSSDTGLCGAELRTGDQVLLFPDCFNPGCVNPTPLRLSGVPATAKPGETAKVKVDDMAFDGTATPASGATVTAGGQTLTTGADGTATVAFSGSGPVAIQATKANKVRSATESTCVTTGADGACGTSVPPPPCATNGHDGLCNTADTTAPTVRLLKAYDGWYYSRRHAPRTLRGTVSADPSGIKDVQVRLKRRQGKRCASYSSGKERFVKRSCKRNASYFSVGDRETWSYLLPARLRPGKYTLDARVIDNAGNVSALKRGRNRVVFHVL
jgi:hypothetical protein